MLKFLIFIALFAVSSFFLTEAYSLEVEFQKESERIIDSMGWLEPEKVPYQEQIQLIIDYTDSKNRIAIGMLSKSPNDMRFPDYIEDIVNEPKVISFLLTNEFGCVPAKIDRACVIIDVERAGLGDNVVDIRENTRKITDPLVDQGVILFAAEFDSVTLQPKANAAGEQVFVSRAVYTVNKATTSSLFNAISTMVLSADIRNSGGFYDHAVELAKNNFSAFTISLTPQENGMLRALHVSLICSDKSPELVHCPGNLSEQIANGEISPLDFLEVENLSRSNVFADQFLPLNSVIQVKIISDEQSLEVKTVNTHLIEKLQNIGDVQDGGWIFSETARIVDGKYIFGQEPSVNKSDLVFSFGPNTGDPIDVRDVKDGGGCLIATAAFGSEMAPQIQFLREIRDNTVLQTEYGSMFMAGFNQFYYSFSPAIADYERENSTFKESIKLMLTPLLASLTLLQYADIDSESKMLGYGISIILLNIGIYFIGPAILIMKIKKRI